jgi:hypothetical protein
MLTQVTLYNNLKQQVTLFVKKLSLNKYVNQTGRKLALSLTDILSLALFKHTAQIETKKRLWQVMEVPCSYKTLVVNVNRFFSLALMILALILKSNKQSTHLVKHIDSTDIPVCGSRKAGYHQTMKQFSNWGKTGKGWFYGLKLHLIADLEGRLLSLKFSSGNVDDRDVVIDLANDLTGIFIADAGYISQDLAERFYQENERILYAKPRANMKKLATMADVYLYSTRMRIELNFRSLKMFYGLVTSLPRSRLGYLANYTYSLLAYCLG